MTTSGWQEAARPLLETGRVEALEHTLDLIWGPKGAAPWMVELLDHYSRKDRLYGHGVSLSPFSSAWGPLEDDWLDRAREDRERWNFRHITEHFGFQRTVSQKNGAPLPLPPTMEAVGLGRERLARMAAVTGTRVGLENLALAFGLEDVLVQGRFLEAVLSAVDGCLLLDLHNLHCQAVNFARPMAELLQLYPLGRVTQIHLSGGSWSDDAGGPPVRRDTHDGAVPEELFDFLPRAIAACPRVEVVVLERLGISFHGEQDAVVFREDFARLEQVLRDIAQGPADEPGVPGVPGELLDCFVEADLVRYQDRLVALLGGERPVSEIPAMLAAEPGLEALAPYLASMEARMLTVGRALTAKWGRPRGPAV